MAQRFTLDSRSFEQFLAAASLLQQFQRQAIQASGPPNFAQHLLELLDTQKAIESGALNADLAIERIVRLALRVLGGEGTAVWLFSNEEFVYRAGSGRPASRDERLRLTVLARVAAICEPSRESFPGQREWAKGAGDSGYYPGCVRSLIVGPIYQNQTVVGALAAFSSGFDAFDKRDAANIRLLSGLIGSAMERAIVPDTQSVALPRQTLLRVIEHIVPTLERLVQQEDSARHSVLESATSHEAAVHNPAVEQPTADAALPTTAAEEVSPNLVSIPAAETSKPKAEIVPALILESALRAQEAEKVSADLGMIPGSETVGFTNEAQALPEPAVEPVAQSSEEPASEVVTAAALREELAQLSRSIAEMDEDEEPAFAAAIAAPDEAISIQAGPVETEPELEPLASATFVAQNEAEQQAEQAKEDEHFTPLDDTSVPGIGVRAALYDDEETQPSPVWASIRAGAASSVHFLKAAAGSASRAFRGAASWTTSSGRQLGKEVRHKVDFRAALPKFPTAKISEMSRRAQVSLSSQVANARTQMPAASSRRLTLPKISTDSARRVAREIGTWFSEAASRVGRGCTTIVNSLPDLPKLSTIGTGPRTHYARTITAEAVRSTHFLADQLRSFQLKVHVNGRALRRSVSALAILLVMSAFLIMESGLVRSDATASANARSEVQTKNRAIQTAVEQPVSTRAIVQPHADSAGLATPKISGPTSHLAITDPSTGDTVQNLTRFEVATLRRQAASGDEEAAFQLGMAYEIGYDMKQDCAKAAEWVTRAAEAGFPAAQYNLGLRYRDGDGVAANPSEAEKWLNKAAARNYRPARVALAKLMPQKR